MDYKEFKKNLPSRKFVIVIGTVTFIVLALLLVTSYFGSSKLFSRSGVAAVTGPTTVGDLVSLDSNNNGIPDWEESLWGLDPKGNGPKNKLIIDQKMSAAGVVPDADTVASAPAMTASDAFAQQILSTVLALNQSGDLNTDSIDQITSTLESNADAHRISTPTYTEGDMTVSADLSPAAKAAYEAAFKAVTLKYKNSGMGTEFDVISIVLDNPDADNEALAIQQLDPIAVAYVQYAKDIMAIPTPSDAVEKALALANASDLTGQSLGQTEKIYSDAVTGMVGLDTYVGTIDPLNQASADMISYFSQQQ